MKHFFDRLTNVQKYVDMYDDIRDKQIIAAFGVQPNEKPFVAASVDGVVLYVCSDYVESQRVLRTMSAICEGPVVYLPAKDDVLLYKRNASQNSVYTRNFALRAIQSGAVAAVTCVETLLQYLPEREKFVSDCFDVVKGVCYDTRKLARKLVSCGYKRVDGISSEGEFVLRGDILDISMPFGARYRVDFFDDEVESISNVSGEEQRPAQSFSVYPLYDTSGLSAENVAKVGQLAARSKLSPNASARLNEIISELALSAADGVADSCWLTPFCQTSTLYDYLPQNTIIFWDEPKLLVSRCNFLQNEHATRIANLTKAGEVMPVHCNSLRQGDVFQTDLPQILLQTLPYQSQFAPNAIYNFKTGAVPSYAANIDDLATDIRNWKQSGYETVILAGLDGVDAIRDKLASAGAYVTQTDGKLLPEQADGIILPIGVEKGFVSHTNRLVVIGARDLGRGIKSQAVSKTRKQAFLSAEKGDYVVHEVHGIGLCEGIQKITLSNGEQKDYVVVLYKNGDKLYVPIDATNLLSRYSGGENPALSKLGGEEFAKVKNKVKDGIKAMSIDLLKLYAEREKARGFKYHIDSYLDEEFEQYFPYTATDDQVRCQQEIAKDLTSDRIMDRVLVGDVGYGKTEVAMRAAFDVVSNGYQVAVLAPTTILAEQHYKTFSERMQPFDIKVACLNRFRSADEQQKILQSVKEGSVDVVIGTHRLLSRDVQFAKLGLLVLDEEQRFGVEHKEKLKAIKTNVDVLTMSATPIPRTLQMALSGIRDISTITTPPALRMAVETFVTEENDALITDVITRELARGGQVYCVYNRVRSIDAFARKLSELVPNAKLIVAHGQMSETELEDAILAFSQNKADVLVCTTIIENGIDIPNVNTLIVIDADKMGLSQLYQLRGRVGRSNRLAYAYFTYRQDKILSETAYKRLSSITEYSELGSGFKIAMKDLEIRGAGNILGREQHGHIMKVGYDMYAKLLKEAVSELKGEKTEKQIFTDIVIDIEAYAPDSYIPVQNERMTFYQQLAACESLEEIASVQKQLQDVYGAAPRQVDNIFQVAELKLLANKAGVCKVTVKSGKGEITFADKEKMMRKEVFVALSDFGDRASASNGSYSVTFSSTDYMQKKRLIDAMKDFLRRIQS